MNIQVMGGKPLQLMTCFWVSKPMVKSVYHWTESISYLGLKRWDILPEKIKNIENLDHFKIEIKTWKPDNCPCRLCKVFIESVGFP